MLAPDYSTLRFEIWDGISDVHRTDDTITTAEELKESYDDNIVVLLIVEGKVDYIESYDDFIKGCKDDGVYIPEIIANEYPEEAIRIANSDTGDSNPSVIRLPIGRAGFIHFEIVNDEIVLEIKEV